MSYTEEVGNKLNNLLTKSYDAEAGYKKAAEKVSNTGLKNFFNNRAQDRYNFGHEIKEEVRSFGQEVDKGTSFTADAHRAWMDIKAAFTTDNDEAVLEEAIRGEKASVETYNEVLAETTLPSSTRTILEQQRNSIQNALNEVKTLEEWA
ncbi:PA2169 family four-helix-bundle protein [uncultured Dokdonia sp.]|uniref:ferritin-like domain-containing protein n=1 Tax=Dokdonia sp. Asnod2-E02 TaxID=3160574 RepID=UPI00262C54BC|nr:PA2169 family four-helix-bundle protein [uncultured Dokdonia sp.]